MWEGKGGGVLRQVHARTSYVLLKFLSLVEYNAVDLYPPQPTDSASDCNFMLVRRKNACTYIQCTRENAFVVSVCLSVIVCA